MDVHPHNTRNATVSHTHVILEGINYNHIPWITTNLLIQTLPSNKCPMNIVCESNKINGVPVRMITVGHRTISLCELEERRGVDLGRGYKNAPSLCKFYNYIAQEQQQGLVDALSKAKFFSLQADGSTDSGNVSRNAMVKF